MIRVTVEMVPFGMEEIRRTLGVMEISNIGKIGNRENSPYSIEVGGGGERKTDYAEIKKFDRSRGFWALILEALKEIV